MLRLAGCDGLSAAFTLQMLPRAGAGNLRSAVAIHSQVAEANNVQGRKVFRWSGPSKEPNKANKECRPFSRRTLIKIQAVSQFRACVLRREDLRELHHSVARRPAPNHIQIQRMLQMHPTFSQSKGCVAMTPHTFLSLRCLLRILGVCAAAEMAASTGEMPIKSKYSCSLGIAK